MLLVLTIDPNETRKNNILLCYLDEISDMMKFMYYVINSKNHGVSSVKPSNF